MQCQSPCLRDDGLFITTGWINVNTGCQNRCDWCYLKEGLDHSPIEMSEKMAVSLVELYGALKVSSLIFIGGEPTLYKYLTSLVELGRIVDIPMVTVVTNGRRLADMSYTFDLAGAGLDIFSISIHSANEAVHDPITKRFGSWREVVKGIGNAVQAGKKVSLNIIAGPQNIESLPDSMPFFLDKGIDEIILSSAIPCITSTGINGENSLEPMRFVGLIEDVKDMSSKIKILHELPLCIIPKETVMELSKTGRLGFGCHIGIGYGLAVDATGCAIPCNSFHSHPLLSLFDERDNLQYTAEGFLQVWMEKMDIKEFRDAVNVYRSDHCKECGIWELCNCGCPVGWGHYNPEDYINANLADLTTNDLNNWWEESERTKGGEWYAQTQCNEARVGA